MEVYAEWSLSSIQEKALPADDGRPPLLLQGTDLDASVTFTGSKWKAY
jgi:hypothetical protein